MKPVAFSWRMPAFTMGKPCHPAAPRWNASTSPWAAPSANDMRQGKIAAVLLEFPARARRD
jgi:hypothetical protein